MPIGGCGTHKPIAVSFFKVAADFPAFPAIITEAGVVTYVHLAAAALEFEHRMRALDVTRNSVVALNTGDIHTSLSVLLATSLIGCRLATASKVLANQKFIEPTHFFRTDDARGKRGVNFVEIGRGWFEAALRRAPDTLATPDCDADIDDPWLVLHTSGTTGRAKFFYLTQRAVADRTVAISADFPTAQVTCKILFNCTTRPFYARAIGALLNACTIVDSEKSKFWIFNGVNVVFGSPSQVETFRKEYGFSDRLKKIEISGAKLHDDLARAMAGSFDEIEDVYGASETNKSFANSVTVSADGRVIREGRKLDSEIEIIDAQGTLCAPGQSGTVRVRNHYMVDTYLNDPEASARCFRDGWFYPGDIGQWGPNGELDILGRNDEIISFGGIKIDAQLIDVIIKSTPGVRDAVCFKSPKADRNEVCAFIVFDTPANRAACTAQVRENYQKHTGLPCFLGPLHEIDEVPYTENGRPMRALCQEMILDRAKPTRVLDGE